MSETLAVVASAGVPVVQMDPGSHVPAASVPPAFSGKWEDMAKDMAAIAQEQDQPAQPDVPAGLPQAAATEPATVQEPTLTPESTQPAATPQAEPKKAAVEIPEKFKGPDGALDQEKVLKSYFEAEKGLKRLQNQAHQQPQPANQPGNQQQQQTPAIPANLTPFELQVAQDIFSGGGFTEQQAVSIARVQVKLAEAKHQADIAATFSKVHQFEQTLEEQAHRSELESLAKNNPWVLTPQGQADLVKVREENPWLNQSPQPWKAAALCLLGQQTLSKSGHHVPVNMPIPSGVQQTVNPLPATPAQTPAAQPTKLNTPEEVAAYVKTLTPEQEAEFWIKSGFRWDAPRKQYMGI